MDKAATGVVMTCNYHKPVRFTRTLQSRNYSVYQRKRYKYTTKPDRFTHLLLLHKLLL